MALYPHEAEARAFANARNLTEWVGLSLLAYQAFETQVGDLQDEIRNIAILPKGIIVGAVDAAWIPAIAATPTTPKIPARRFTPVEAAQVGLIWRIARRLGADNWNQFTDVDPFVDITTGADAAANAVYSGATTAGNNLWMQTSVAKSENLFISDLPRNIDDNMLLAVFSAYGQINSHKILTLGPQGNRCAVVSFRYVREATWIVDNLNGNIPQGLISPITVRYSSESGAVSSIR